MCYSSILFILITFSLLILTNQVSQTLRIGSFNLRRYGPQKSDNAYSNLYITKIILRYDIIFLTELNDQTGSITAKLLENVNKLITKESDKFNVMLSNQLGDTSYKERFAYFYRTNNVQFTIVSDYVYDGGKGLFERSPYIMKIQISRSRTLTYLTFVGVHLKPENVYSEFKNLRKVVDELDSKRQNKRSKLKKFLQMFKKRNNSNTTITPLIIMGDFNADCSYLNNQKKKDIRENYFNDFTWLIDDKMETNLLETCSYDRILIKGSSLVANVVQYSNQVFAFDKEYDLTKQLALQVSDHYPVEFEIFLKN